jgi:hypothetical protein
MTNLALSQHAEIRSLQRSVPPLVLKWLMNYGAHQSAHNGAEIFYFDKKSRKQIAQDNGHEVVERLGRLLDAYAVIGGDGTVITVGRRYRRIRRH